MNSPTPQQSCPVCQHPGSRPFHDIAKIPIACNVLWATKKEAQNAPRGDISLCFCERCGYIFNRLFQPELMVYNQQYENSLHHSPRFQAYARRVIDELVDRYGLRQRKIIEIGAGQGDFLKMLCLAGDNQAVGFDPAYVADENTPPYLRFIADSYTEKYAGFPADVIICRHVLEHIHQAADFMAMVRRIIDQRLEILVFFEVPNVLWTLRRRGIWDIIYEHCGYFSPASLAYLFSQNRFKIEGIQTVFGGQFLTIEARPSSHVVHFPKEFSKQVEGLAADVRRFSALFQQNVDHWQQTFVRLKAAGERAVIWGAGSKGVTFLNILNPAGIIDYAVDINPRKEGMFVAGTGQAIVPPSFLSQYRPDAVIIMNKNYREEIGQMLRELGVSATILTA